MAHARRERLQLDVRRARLLERGKALFNSKAYDEVSIDEIAAAAGISRGLLYHYFSCKRVFYVETVRAGAEEMLALTASNPDDAPAEQLQRGLGAYLDYVEQNARAYAALLRGGIGHDPEVVQIIDATRDAMIRRIARGMGVDEPPPPMRLALRSWTGFVEAAALDWVERPVIAREQLVGMLVATLLACTSSVPLERGATSHPPSPRGKR